MSFPLLGRHNERVKLIRALHTAAGRERIGCFLAEGPRVVSELLHSAFPVRLLLCRAREEHYWSELAAAAVKNGAEVYEAEEQLLEQLSPAKTSQGVLAVAELPSYTWEHLLSCARIVVLEGIQDPGNVGTLLRSARAFGFAGALCLGGADPFNARAVRSSAGAVFALPILRFSAGGEISEWLKPLQKGGFALITAVAHGGVSLPQTTFPNRAALLLGAEVSGVSAEASGAAAVEVTIPLEGNCESLNVAVAGSVLMYEMSRRVITDFN
ncbi:MAG: RNA methyltransferase [bacterium]|nr:RNA methyltransferase [bacterium]